MFVFTATIIYQFLGLRGARLFVISLLPSVRFSHPFLFGGASVIKMPKARVTTRVRVRGIALPRRRRSLRRSAVRGGRPTRN